MLMLNILVNHFCEKYTRQGLKEVLDFAKKQNFSFKAAKIQNWC